MQLLDIFYQAGNWFCHAYNLDLKRWFVLRLDKFETVKLLNTKQSVMNKEQLLDSFRQYEQEHYCIPYQCQLTKIGEQKVEYNSYPIMQIDHKHGKIYLNGKYNKEELHYLVNYLISLGSEVKVLKPKVLKPKELKDSYLEKLNEIIQQY
ncbi:WYL domain-containing protein [Lactobacillus gasseri]|uniref:Repressor protein n=1 Tax=Lactobacillus gasseri SV-16A-US TaxID=575604 RepID=A0AB34P1A9_LACGS|nr:WYL domain-containing protein [Lactobacillus gasseri]KFL97568.1 putative repressor protein [Lactobacillus gasseri SV-16A-US]MCZ3947037.1 WYL domain-containing protein [Lactobacillus gasseri]